MWSGRAAVHRYIDRAVCRRRLLELPPPLCLALKPQLEHPPLRAQRLELCRLRLQLRGGGRGGGGEGGGGGGGGGKGGG